MSEATNSNSNKINLKDPGFLGEMFNQLRLTFRLLKDPDVPIYLKVIPFSAIAYWLFPLEGAVNPLLLTPVDDIALFVVSITTFIQLAPAHVVEKHRAALDGRVSAESTTEQVVEGEWETVAPSADAIDPLDEVIILNPDKVNA